MSAQLLNKQDDHKSLLQAPKASKVKRLRRNYMSRSRKLALVLGAWGLGTTLLAGVQTARVGVLESELHELPQTMAALESRVAARSLAVEQRQQELEALLDRYDLIMQEDPRAPELLNRGALLQDENSLDDENAVLLPSGGPFDSDPVKDQNIEAHPVPTPRPNMNGADLSSLGASVLGLFGSDSAEDHVDAIAHYEDSVQFRAPRSIALPQVAQRQWPEQVSPQEARSWTEENVGRLAEDVAAVDAMQKALILGMVKRLDETISRRQEILSTTGADLSDVLQAYGVNAPAETNLPMGGPYSPINIEQEFGNSVDEYLLDRLKSLAALNDALTFLPIRRPVSEELAYVSSTYGHRRDPIRRRHAFHAGLDLAGRSGTPIHATAEGTVVRAERAGPYGNLVEIDHGFGIHTRYAHLRRIDVVAGEAVAVGQQVGAMGTTGRSTGTHLHYEIWVDGGHVDPAPFIEVGGDVAREHGTTKVSVATR